MNQIHKLLHKLLDANDGPLSRELRKEFQKGGWEALQQRPSLDPGSYENADEYFRDAVLNDFARKSPPVEGDLHETAVKAFWECEKDNKHSNDRLSRFVGLQGPFSEWDEPFIQLITEWRAQMSALLGRLPADLDLRFSSGATVGASGQHISIPHKIDSVPVLYPGSLCMKPFIERTSWGRLHWLDYRVTRGNYFFSVPKDAKKNRGCCKEASAVVALQLAFGKVWRQKLQAVGIDLRLGQALHANLARLGSLGAGFATIDLSNASDLIPYLIVKLVVPDVWFQVLDSLRAPFTNVEGKWVKLEKFSSMGNGFTFELETALFYTLIRAVEQLTGISTPCHVYGDDMIVTDNPAFLKTLYGAFKFAGFRPNENKSYTSGHFRESCGGDFFRGVAVRPYFLKNYPVTPSQWIAVHNGLHALNRPTWTKTARDFCVEQIPRQLRLKGPRSLGDLVLHGFSREEWRSVTDRNAWCGHWNKVLQPMFQRLPLSSFHPSVVLASALYGVPSSGVVPRQEPLGHKVSKVFVASASLSYTESMYGRDIPG